MNLLHNLPAGQLLGNAEIGKVRTRPHVSGFPTYRDLAGYRTDLLSLPTRLPINAYGRRLPLKG